MTNIELSPLSSNKDTCWTKFAHQYLQPCIWLFLANGGDDDNNDDSNVDNNNDDSNDDDKDADDDDKWLHGYGRG